MILDAKHKYWALVCAALAVVAAGLYALQAWLLHPVPSSGGSVAGLWFGITGTLQLAFAGLLPLRKWRPLARIGSAQSWLRAHIWLSLLGSLLIVCHSGLRWRGAIEQYLMLLLALLVVSGVWGLIVQSLLTRQLSLQVPWETFYENLPQTCRMLQFEGDVLVASLCAEPLPLEPDAIIARDERLKSRLAKVYASPAAAADAADAAEPMAKPIETPPPPTPAAKPMSTAEKLKLMREKKPAAEPAPPVEAAPVAATNGEPAPTSATPAPAAAASAKGLSTAEKLKLMRAKQPGSAEGAPAPEPAVKPEAGAAPLSTKDKLAMMRAGKQAAASPAADVPAAPIAAAARPPVVRTIEPDALKPFQHELREFFLQRVRPFLALDRPAGEGGLASDTNSTIVFARLAARLPEELHETLAQLETLCERRRQLATQTRLYRWLHGWLVLVHIPAAAALAGLVVVHIAASLYW